MIFWKKIILIFGNKKTVCNLFLFWKKGEHMTRGRSANQKKGFRHNDDDDENERTNEKQKDRSNNNKGRVELASSWNRKKHDGTK
jgi:hypothetical protein